MYINFFFEVVVLLLPELFSFHAETSINVRLQMFLCQTCQWIINTCCRKWIMLFSNMNSDRTCSESASKYLKFCICGYWLATKFNPKIWVLMGWSVFRWWYYRLKDQQDLQNSKEKNVPQSLILPCLDKNSRIFFDRARAEGEIAFITYYSLHCTACKLFC